MTSCDYNYQSVLFSFKNSVPKKCPSLLRKKLPTRNKIGSLLFTQIWILWAPRWGWRRRSATAGDFKSFELKLNGRNGSNLICKENFFKAGPRFFIDCVAETKNCPLRVAEKLLKKFGYNLKKNNILELRFHEWFNNYWSNLAIKVQEKIDLGLKF